MTNFSNLIKYPKTHHILGSKECDVDFVPIKFTQNDYESLESIQKYGSLVIEEKMDGMGIGIFFNQNQAWIQFRGQIIQEENCPREFMNVFSWIEKNKDLLFSITGENKIIWGEWMDYQHCMYYNALPSYFIEYDIYDIENKYFLDTTTRKQIINKANLNHLNKIVSAHVVEKKVKTAKDLSVLFKEKIAFGKNKDIVHDFEKNNFKGHVRKNSLVDIYPEGYYLKIENSGEVIKRFKFIRKSFLEKILENSHWKNSQWIKNNCA